jgi:hypothetical protein
MRLSLSNQIFRKALVVLISSALVTFPIYPPGVVQAFIPTNTTAFFLAGFGNNSHQSITEDAIKAIDQEFFSINKLSNSMKKAMKEIVAENAGTDAFEGLSGSEKNQAECAQSGSAAVGATIRIW